MLHRCQPCNFHMNIASALPSPLSRRFLCQTQGEICLRLVTRGEGFHRPQPGCGACLGEIEAFLSAWWAQGDGAGGDGRGQQDGREKKLGKGGGGASIGRPSTLRLRFPSVGKRGATYTGTLIDACARVLINIIIKRAWSHTHSSFFSSFLVEGWWWQSGLTQRLTDSHILGGFAW